MSLENKKEMFLKGEHWAKRKELKRPESGVLKGRESHFRTKYFRL